MNILGLDVSLNHTGWARWNGEIQYGEWQPKTTEEMPRLAWIMEQVYGAIPDVDLVVMEAFSYGSPNQAHQLGGVNTMIRYALWRRNIPVIQVAPVQLKKFVTGKAKAEKEIIIREVYKRWSVDVRTNNEADAVVLLVIGAALTGQMTVTMQAQMEVLQAVRGKFAKELTGIAVDTPAAL